MGLRFKKSVKICKGVRLNFNKNSFGLSVGGRGYGYTINSKGRTTAHVGIPGTGLSYSQSYGTSSNKNSHAPVTNYRTAETAYKLQMDEDGKMSFFYTNGIQITDQTLINKIKKAPGYQQEKERMQLEHDADINKEIQLYNNQNSDLVDIFRESPQQVFNLEFYKIQYSNFENGTMYMPLFEEAMPTMEMIREEIRKEANSKIKTLAFWKKRRLCNDYVAEKENQRFSDYMNVWTTKKEQFENQKQEEFQSKKMYLSNIIKGDNETICRDIDIWLDELESPLEFNIDYELNSETGSFLIDLDLPEIENFPNQKATQLANGNFKLKNKSKGEIAEDYKRYVFGLAIFLCTHIFNVSPRIDKITISGYTQRRDKVGQIKDDYIYSIIFVREKMYRINYKTQDPVLTCMSFENRCNILSSGLLKTITPYEN